MVVVIFEVEPAAGKQDAYLALAAQLYDELNEIDGFISIERFRSIHNESKLLSLSFWKDENSVANWRNSTHHRSAESEGRASVFQNYRLRVASVLRDYGMYEREEAPADSKQYHHIK
jgi:heme-degrading monooxygenase HmoA